MANKIYIGVIGAGYWGLNLIRNFYNIGVLKSVADLDVSRQVAVKKISKDIIFSTNYKKILEDDSILAVVISTPAKTHYKVAKDALNSTTVVNTIALTKGCKVLRVHDVKQAKEILKIIDYLKEK